MPDPASDYGTAWERFQGTSSVRLLQETLEWEWTRGRTDFVAFLIPIGGDAVREYISSRTALIDAIPGIDVYPERYWHITVKQVGFLRDPATEDDEVSTDDVREIAEAARLAIEGTQRFDVRVGAANAFPEVVFLEVHDGGAVRTLNERLLEHVPNLRRYPVDGEFFLPHVSVARYSSMEGLPELKDTLARMREEPVGPTFEVAEVLLIRARLSDEAPEFDLLAQYTLGDK